MIIDRRDDGKADNPDLPKAKTIKELDADDQPRERALKHGVEVLGNADLLALILRTGLPGKPITELCRDLMRANGGNLHTLERRTRAELLEIKGFGTTKVIQIEAVMELIRRYCKEAGPSEARVETSKDIAAIMRPIIGNLPHEEIWAMFLNRSLRVIRLFKMSSGSSTGTVFDVKMMIKQALLENTESLVLCHNHPSGNTVPSVQDDNITRKCAEACKMMDIRFLDHVIVTSASHYSYSDANKL